MPIDYFNLMDLDHNYAHDEYGFLNVKYLNDTFIASSSTINLYGHNIRVLWKGQMQTVQEVYDHSIITLIVNQFDLIWLYDIYFKVYLAVIYYERQHVIIPNVLRLVVNCFAAMENILENLDTSYFPQHLRPLASSIITLLNMPQTLATSDERIDDEMKMARISAYAEQIEEEFEKPSFFFEHFGTVNTIERQPKNISMHTLDAPYLINDELKIVKNFYYNYYMRFEYR